MSGERVLKYKVTGDYSDINKQLDEIEKRSANALSPKLSNTKFDFLAQSLKSADQFTQKLNSIQQTAGRINSKPLFDLATSTKQLEAFEKKLDDVNKKASNFKLDASSGSSSGSGGFGGVAKGGLDLVGLGKLASVAGAAALAVDGLNKLGEKAKDTSQIISDSGGPYDQLRQSSQKVDAAFNKLASSPAIAGLEKLKNDVLSNGLGLLTGLFGGQDTSKGLDAGQRKTLVGETKLQKTLLNQERGDLEKGQALETEKLNHDLYTKKRDLEIEFQEFSIGQERKKADIAKKLSDENQEYSIQKTRLNADVEFKSQNQKWTMDRQFEQRSFQQKQGDERQLASFAAQDRAAQATFAAQDRNLQLNKTLGRNAEDFRDRLTDMARSGAGGMEYLTTSRDFNKQQRRTSEDAAIEQAQANRNFGYENYKAGRDLIFKQGTEKRDFGQSQQKSVAEHLIDTDVHRYQVGQQMLDLEIRHTHALRDLTIEEERRAQDEKIGKQKLGNKKSDLEFETQFETKQTRFNQEKALRGQRQKELDFASQFSKLSYDDQKALFQSDPNLGYDYAQSQGQRGLNPFPGAEKNAGEELGKKIREGIKNFSGAIKLDTKGVQTPVNKVGPMTDIDFGQGMSGLGKLPESIWNAIPGHDLTFGDIGDWFTGKNKKTIDPFHLEGRASGGPIPTTKPYLLHEGEYVLTKQETRRVGLLGTPGNQLNPLNGDNSSHAGFGYGRGGATGLIPLGGNISNATANGAPLSLPPSNPINMPNSQPPPQINYSPAVNLNMGDGLNLTPDLQMLGKQLEQYANSKIQAVMSQQIGAFYKGYAQMQQAGGGFR
jgi:hypothetical protein